ncbi:MAG: diaminopimelate epimerase [Candidatus Omnitrophota bacterium]
MKKIAFTKMQGAGNDFAVIEHAKGNLRALAQKMCHRKFGIGADGILVLGKSKKTDYRMRIFNSDGSEAEMCGNGVRCLASYIVRNKNPKKKIFGIETLAGIIYCEAKNGVAQAHLSAPKNYASNITLNIFGRALKVNFIDTGVPHAVVFVDSLEKIDVERIAPQIRWHKKFAPRGANVNFVEQVGKNFINVRTFERGVEGETLACGTGSVASAAIAFLKANPNAQNAKQIVKVLTKGGETLLVTVELINGKVQNVWLKGKTDFVSEGVYYDD